MTLQECTAVMATLAIQLQKDIDEPTFRAFHKVLRDVPAALFEATCEAIGGEAGRRFYPSAPELLEACERTRRRLQAAHPWTPCAECEDQPGWVTVQGEDGVSWVTPCPCKARHRELLQSRGFITAPLCALPPADEKVSA